MTKHSTNGKTQSKVPDKGRQQQDTAQELARAQAERMLTPVEPQAPAAASNGTHAAEPSLEQRLADIDRRAKERASEEKAAVGQPLPPGGPQRLPPGRQPDDRRGGQVGVRGDAAAGENGRLIPPPPRPTACAARPAAGDRPTRERRSPDSLRSDAQKIADWLRGHPGSKGSAAVEATGVVVKQPLNVRTFRREVPARHQGQDRRPEGRHAVQHRLRRSCHLRSRTNRRARPLVASRTVAGRLAPLSFERNRPFTTRSISRLI